VFHQPIQQPRTHSCQSLSPRRASMFGHGRRNKSRASGQLCPNSPCHFVAIDAMVAGNHQPAFVRSARELNTVTGPRRIPIPVLRLNVGCNFPRLCPHLAVIARGRDEDAIIFARERHPDHARVLIEHGAGVADRDLRGAAFFVDQLERSPSFPAVGTLRFCTRSTSPWSPRPVLRPSQMASNIPFFATSSTGMR